MVTVVLASPDASGPNNPMDVVAEALEAAGHAAIVVGLDPRGRDDAIHEQRLRSTVAGVDGPVVLGGFSLGARIAVQLVPELAPLGLRAVLGFGFPFHAAGQPRPCPGLEALARVRIPTRIIQGTRDSHGSQAEIRGYGPLPESVELVWVPDANHRFRPRARSGLDPAAALEWVTRSAIEFVDLVDGGLGR